MPEVPAMRATARRSLLLVLLALGPLALGSNQCGQVVVAPPIPVGKPLFTSPQVNPVAVSNDGALLYVANTTTGTLSFVDVTNPAAPRELVQVPVGIDPVGVAVRPKVNPSDAGEDELVFVTNHISDSVSVVSRRLRAVVQTLQELEHADGGSTPDDLVTTTDEPVGVAFADACRAFVTLDQPNQVLALEIADGNHDGLCDDATGSWSIAPVRLPITAQAPRALAVANGKLFVAAFESGNQTEFPTCAAEDPRGFTPGDPYDEGCEFKANLIDNITFSPSFSVDLGTIFDFAARNPNIGGRVIHDGDIPDRDVFVFDLAAPGFDSDPSKPGAQPLQTIEHLGTLLYGVAAGSGGRVYVADTDARNHLNGLGALGNRMFENRLSILDCGGGSCGAPVTIDLDAEAAALGSTVPTPYGLAVSGDGATLVVTAAGSDGKPGLPGLYTLDRDGHVVGRALVGAIPQGVALRSAPSGQADRAFVLNTVDSTLSVVDVHDPASPVVEATIPVGADPTPAAVKAGRVAFTSARGSTSGTFSCESCHPNGNIDQLLWTINAVEGPDDPPGLEPPEPRTTMPIRGLRDTLPLHWEGRLADPFPGVGANLRQGLVPGDSAPDCDLAVDGEIGCIRHLVNASLAGVMCAQPSCPIGPSGLKGAYTNQERTEMATFLQAVTFPPAPRRRPSDKLSPTANQGVEDFFTNEDGQGIGTGVVGGVVGFGVVTCADNAIGCHSLPLTVGTNSRVVGFFDAPSARGLWDRSLLFSNGIVSSEEFMRLAQACADGYVPPAKLNGLVSGDPCAIQSVLPIALMPTGVFPPNEHIYDPAEGYTERGAFLATFRGVFALAYGVPGDRIWEYQVEIGTGLPGLTGRQVELAAGNADDPQTLAEIAQLEQGVADGKIVAVARTADLQELRFDAATSRWTNASGRLRLATADLRALATTKNAVFTLTAAPPAGITGGGPDRQPLLDIDPDVRAAEMALTTGQAPGIPRPTPNAPASFRVGAKYMQPGASILIDGARCAACAWAPATAASGDPAADVSVPQGFAPGMHVMRMQNPGGWVSNELPVLAK
jgi:DNA-binding beta-propeller fold protein YncE